MIPALFVVILSPLILRSLAGPVVAEHRLVQVILLLASLFVDLSLVLFCDLEWLGYRGVAAWG
jgi:hypothetical protein